MEKPKNLTMTSVVSSNVKSVGFADNTLFVVFNSGDMYAYLGVPKELYDKLFLEESVGKFINREIKTVYPYEKVL